MAGIKKQTTLESLRNKWANQNEKKAKQEAHHQEKLNRIMDAVNVMSDEQLPKTMEMLILHSGFQEDQCRKLFKELFGTSIKKYYKNMHSNNNLFDVNE